MGNKMELEVKNVEFNGAELLAAKSEDDGKVYVGVRWVCEGIGLTKGQMQNERKKVSSDIVLNKGERNLVLPTSGGNQEIQAIDIEFLPLWLAKISITPTMQKNSPDTVENLVSYQLQAKDVLAKAFLNDSFTTMVDEYTRMSDIDKAITHFQQLKENEILNQTLQIQAPKVEGYDKFMNSDELMDMETVAKLLNERLTNTKTIGRNVLFKFLRNEKILQTAKFKGDPKHNMPYQYYIDQGHFEVKAKSFDMVLGNGEVVKSNSYKTHATSKGLEYIRKMIQDRVDSKKKLIAD